MTPEEVAARAESIADDVRARGTELRFDYAGVSIAYRSDEAATGEWISQFLEGYFVPADAGKADATVCSTADPALFAALQTLSAEHPTAGRREHVEIPFVPSVALIRRTAGKAAPGDGVHLLLFERDRTIVLVTSGDLEVRREEGMQLLRALGKWLLLEQGWIPMHSACAAKSGRAICIAGEKASGKTSTLLNLLARNGCDLAAVDKFLLRSDGARLEICGIPGKIGVRVGTALAQPWVLEWLADESSSFFPRMSLEEVQHIADTNSPEQLRVRKEKMNLLPAELAGLVRRSISPTAPLGLVLIPVFDLSVAESRLVPVEREQAIETLMKSYAGILTKGEGFLRHFFDVSDRQLEDRLAVLLRTCLPEGATYEVHQNHRTNEHTANLVTGLLSSVP